MSDTSPELAALRAEIATVDRSLLDGLNRRLELVRRVRAHKDAASVRFVDAEREATLLGELAAANNGPLSERGLTAIFSAVLDVMKQELPAERPAPAAVRAPVGVERIAIVGTGLVGTSVGLAAGRAGVASVHGVRRRSGAARAGVGARQLRRTRLGRGCRSRCAAGRRRGSRRLCRVDGARGACRSLCRRDRDRCRLDQARARRGDRRPALRPRSPGRGRREQRPDRAAAELFDGATWFLTPRPGTDPARVDAVERFVSASAHDRCGATQPSTTGCSRSRATCRTRSRTR